MSTWKEHTSSNLGVQGFIPMPRKSHGWRSLVGYTPWGHKESDTTEWLHFLSFFIKVINCNVQTYSNALSVWLSLMERDSKTLGAQMVKHLPTMREAPVRSPGQEDPLRRKWQPTPVLLPGKSHGQRSLVGCSPRGRKELDTTEWLHFHGFYSSCHDNRNFSLKSCHFLFYICWGCYRLNILNCHNLLGELVILKLCSDPVYC